MCIYVVDNNLAEEFADDPRDHDALRAWLRARIASGGIATQRKRISGYDRHHFNHASGLQSEGLHTAEVRYLSGGDRGVFPSDELDPAFEWNHLARF